MHRRWLVSRTNPEYISYISKAVSISPVLAQILINRGLKTPQEIAGFLNPDLSNLSDPFEITGMEVAVKRIKLAVKNNETVFVHGDYDADGLSSAAIMVQALKMHGLNVHYFIPNRIAHGYGFSPGAVGTAQKLGAALIITVDCGITSFDTAACAKAKGIDVIITDHHEPVPTTGGHADAETRRLGNNSPIQKFMLPDAVAVVNPKLSAGSPLSILSGAGIALKLIQALDSELGTQRSALFLDLAAIGTIADVVPLTGENRIIVAIGMKLIQEGRRQGIRALKSASGLDGRTLKTGLLSFTLIPRINAAGRIADSGDVVRLLLTDEAAEAAELSLWLDSLNSERQKIEEKVYQDALSKLDAAGISEAVVLSGEGWHRGVLGIVAARVAEEFNRPAFVFSVENGIAKGSARSIPSFDICNGLSGCRDILLSFGGHKQAAGIRLRAENIPLFEEKIRFIIRNSLAVDDFIPCLAIDADIPLSAINHSLINELALLSPLGYGNEEPNMGSKGLEVINARIVGNNHLKMRLKQGSQSIDAIGFDMGELEIPPFIDAVFNPTINEWERGKSIQLNLKAFRPNK